ncbi:hypothetical protein GCM10023336_19860 [Streptomyces similanensis]|uniref:Pentapeptide repeat-containing protein n=1 Tax=Streptomyces similanensis TaxID=1274988 RepID=A0ABP9K5B6_9ACTN
MAGGERTGAAMTAPAGRPEPLVAPGRVVALRCGAVRLDPARSSSARLGSARFGSARFGSARLRGARFGSARLRSEVGLVRLRPAPLRLARPGSV